jgi:hypothetical protein
MLISPWDSDLRKTALGMLRKNWKLQTRLLVREGSPHTQIRNCIQIIKERRWETGRGAPDGCLAPRESGRLTVGHNITSAWCRLEPVAGQRTRSQLPDRTPVSHWVRSRARREVLDRTPKSSYCSTSGRNQWKWRLNIKCLTSDRVSYHFGRLVINFKWL